MIDYDSFSLCHLADIFFAMHAGAIVLSVCTAFFFSWSNSSLLRVISRVAIPSLFIRFVLILESCVLEKYIVLISKECTYFGHLCLF